MGVSKTLVSFVLNRKGKEYRISEDIANITVNLDLVNMKERTEGYRQALRDASIIVDGNQVKELPFLHDNKDVARAIKGLVGKSGNKKVGAILFSTSKLGIIRKSCGS